MTDTTHTPGPWKVSQPSGNYIDTAAGHSVAALTFSATPADAHLLAAAPELLAALDEIFNGVGMTGPTMDAARAAIAKAKGQS
jgi:hypothetical protein